MSVIINHDTLEFTQVAEVSRLPRSVETTAKNIETNFENTTLLLILTAEKLEARAKDLREKAQELSSAISIAEDLRRWVKYERDYFDEVKSLALVDIGIRNSD